MYFLYTTFSFTGVVCGLSQQNKYSTLFLVAPPPSLHFGTSTTGHTRYLRLGGPSPHFSGNVKTDNGVHQRCCWWWCQWIFCGHWTSHNLRPSHCSTVFYDDVREAKWHHQRIDWETHVFLLQHENLIKQTYRMSLAAFQKLRRILGKDIIVDEVYCPVDEPIVPELIVAVGIRYLSGGKCLDL